MENRPIMSMALVDRLLVEKWINARGRLMTSVRDVRPADSWASWLHGAGQANPLTSTCSALGLARWWAVCYLIRTMERPCDLMHRDD